MSIPKFGADTFPPSSPVEAKNKSSSYVDIDTLLISNLIQEDTLYAGILCLLETLEYPSMSLSRQYDAVDELLLTYKIMHRALKCAKRPVSDALKSFRCDIDYLRREGFYKKTTQINLDDFDPKSEAARAVARRLIDREWAARVLDSCILTNLDAKRARIACNDVPRHRHPEILLNDFLTNMPNLDTESQASVLIRAFEKAGVYLIVIRPRDHDFSASLSRLIEQGYPRLPLLRPEKSAFRFFLPHLGQNFLSARWFTSIKVADILCDMPSALIPNMRSVEKMAVSEVIEHWAKWEIPL